MHQLHLLSPSPPCSTICFFSSHARSKYLSIFSLSLIFTLWPPKYIIRQVLLLCLLLQCLVFWLQFGDSFESQYPENSIRFIFLDRLGLCIYHLLVWLKCILFYNSQAITSFTHLCLIDFVVLFLLSSLE